MIQWRKDSIFNKVCFNYQVFMCRKINHKVDFIFYIKINPGLLIDLNVKHEYTTYERKQRHFMI